MTNVEWIAWVMTVVTVFIIYIFTQLFHKKIFEFIKKTKNKIVDKIKTIDGILK